MMRLRVLAVCVVVFTACGAPEDASPLDGGATGGGSAATGGDGGSAAGGGGGSVTGGGGGSVTGGGGGSATGGGGGNATCTDTWAAYGSGFFASYCSNCHGNQMASASAVRANSSSITYDISSGRMPRGFTLSSAERTRILQYINCGAP